MPWCIDIGDQKEGGRDDKWQHESNHPCRLVVSRLISEQHVGTYRDGCHEPPSGTWNSIPEGRLCVALRIDHVMPVSTIAAIGVGCALAGPRTVARRLACNWLIDWSICSCRVSSRLRKNNIRW
jgi:hypothetical protein